MRIFGGVGARTKLFLQKAFIIHHFGAPVKLQLLLWTRQALNVWNIFI